MATGIRSSGSAIGESELRPQTRGDKCMLNNALGWDMFPHSVQSAGTANWLPLHGLANGSHHSGYPHGSGVDDADAPATDEGSMAF